MGHPVEYTVSGDLAGRGGQKVYGYQFPTAVKARRAKLEATDRKARDFEASKRAAYDYYTICRLV